MCGIAGILHRTSSHTAPDETLRRMATCIRHRGPDAGGTWTGAQGNVGLAHRRLSIIDLSPDGAQPMTSASGRYTLVFNGEIYNYAALRARTSYPYRGHSDTEVLLALFERHGVADALPLLSGMFAFAVWDAEAEALLLARDRLGEKPLYLATLPEGFAFASELKALTWMADVSTTLDPQALLRFLTFGFVPAPGTPFAAVRKLQPGHLVTIRLDGRVAEHVYWSAAEAAASGLRAPFRGSDVEIVDALDVLLRDVVRREMVSDVPLGAFLSSGVDSSLIVSLMQAQADRPVRSFTIAFDDDRYDESAGARAIAEALGTEHTELAATPADLLQHIERLDRVYDEPLGDVSQLPTMLLCALTRAHVTVALSGDGGDELFGGYRHHRQAGGVERLAARVPQPFRGGVAGLLGVLAAGRTMPRVAPGFLARTGTSRHLPSDLARLGDVLAVDDTASRYAALRAVVPGAERYLARGIRAAAAGLAPDVPAVGSPLEELMLADSLLYLPDDILMKVDRAAMAVGLETRAPLLDHSVYEFAWRIPHGRKVSMQAGKLPLRALLSRYLPADLLEPRKRGFDVPLDRWLRGPLRDWAESRLSPDALARTGVLDVRQVRAAWTAHLSGEVDVAEQLWVLLSLQGFLLAR